MTPIEFLGLYPFQWLAIITAGTTLLLMIDALVGHYRRAFAYRMQYAPAVTGTALTVAALLAAGFPDLPLLNQLLSWAGWLTAATGLVGFGYHFYYGIVTKPGGLKWLLHYLMYGAPIFAPLGLTAAGVLGVITAHGLAGEHAVFGLVMPVALFLFVTIVLAGAIAQAGILHYRGAFDGRASRLCRLIVDDVAGRVHRFRHASPWAGSGNGGTLCVAYQSPRGAAARRTGAVHCLGRNRIGRHLFAVTDVHRRRHYELDAETGRRIPIAVSALQCAG
ncbi:MAG: hypothetical protein LV473_19120 [Nitrospira sp.]|nr:hypothetical protein [Nitrospira sp.]